MDSFAYLMWRILKKLNQNRNANRLSVGVVGFMMMRVLFVIKKGGGFTIICREKEEDEEMKEGERRVACQVITKILLTTLLTYISDDLFHR
jgi:hypothetical protein